MGRWLDETHDVRQGKGLATASRLQMSARVAVHSKLLHTCCRLTICTELMLVLSSGVLHPSMSKLMRCVKNLQWSRTMFCVSFALGFWGRGRTPLHADSTSDRCTCAHMDKSKCLAEAVHQEGNQQRACISCTQPE